MASDGQGTIYIELIDFWEFVRRYSPVPDDVESLYGVPRFNRTGGDLEIDYAFSSENDPETWAIKPAAADQWDEYENGRQRREKDCRELRLRALALVERLEREERDEKDPGDRAAIVSLLKNAIERTNWLKEPG